MINQAQFSFRTVTQASAELPALLWARIGPISQLNGAGARGVCQRPVCIGVTGSRSAPKSSCAQIREFTQWICEDSESLIVSGGALGTDLAAHEGALDSPGGATCIVLPISLDSAFSSRRFAALLQSENVESRLLFLSQFDESDQDFRSMPLRRNETLAALCNVGLVGCCGIKSGTLSTVKHFLRFQIPFYFLQPTAVDSTEWNMAAKYFAAVGGKPLQWTNEGEGRLLAAEVCRLAAEEKTVQHRFIKSQLDLFGE
ncbi:MAG: DNA-processing protein DprA [Sumerlaeia bacterium]